MAALGTIGAADDTPNPGGRPTSAGTTPADGDTFARMSDLTLYRDDFWISPYVFTCDVALREKGLAYDEVSVALQRGEQRTEVFSTGSVTARVPALRHGDFVVAESSAIVEYLEDAFPETPRVLPIDVKERARARQVMSWIRSDDTLPIRQERSTASMFYERTDKVLTADGARAATKLLEVATRLLAHGGEYIGSSWSIADADLAFMLQRLILNGAVVPERMRAYVERVWERPTVQAFVQRERAPYVAY